MTGVISDCASRISLTAAPIAAISDAKVKKASTKKISEEDDQLGSSRPSIANDTSASQPEARVQRQHQRSPTAIWPRILPAISSIGDTAESSTSTTRFDFSSTVDVSRYCPLVMTDISSSIMKPAGMQHVEDLVRGPLALGRDRRDRTRIDVGRLDPRAVEPEALQPGGDDRLAQAVVDLVPMRSSSLPRTNRS